MEKPTLRPGHEWLKRDVSLVPNPTITPLRYGEGTAVPPMTGQGNETRRTPAAPRGPQTVEEWVAHIQAMPPAARREQLHKMFVAKHPDYRAISDTLRHPESQLPAPPVAAEELASAEDTAAPARRQIPKSAPPQPVAEAPPRQAESVAAVIAQLEKPVKKPEAPVEPLVSPDVLEGMRQLGGLFQKK